MKYTCPCCGYKTLEEEPPGTYDICDICFWEDDMVQFSDPHYEGGANRVSLKFVRTPNEHDVKDPKWQSLAEK